MKAKDAKVGELLVSSGGNVWLVIGPNLGVRLHGAGTHTDFFGQTRRLDDLHSDYIIVGSLKKVQKNFWDQIYEKYI